MHDLIIIGGGPAALSAAVYALGKQLNVLVIYEDLGGKAGTQQHLRGPSGVGAVAGADGGAGLPGRAGRFRPGDTAGPLPPSAAQCRGACRLSGESRAGTVQRRVLGRRTRRRASLAAGGGGFYRSGVSS